MPGRLTLGSEAAAHQAKLAAPGHTFIVVEITRYARGSVLHRSLGYNLLMLNIRKATLEDIPLILSLIRELAEYERAPEEAVATAEDLRRDGFSCDPRFFVEIAEWDGEPAGFALWFFNYSTWLGKPGLYLEDLFVRPRFRRKGIGKALLVHLAHVAIDKGCGRYQWQVLDWNTPSIKFYQSLGAKMMTTWLTMRVAGDDLKRLAEMPLIRPASDNDRTTLSNVE